jgi:hypothetical protein
MFKIPQSPLQNLVIERARLEPYALDAQLLRLLQYLDRDLWWGDDRDRGFCGVRQSGEVWEGGVFFDF